MENRFFLDLLTLKSEMQFRKYSSSTQATYMRVAEEFLETTDKEIICIRKEDITVFLDRKMCKKKLDVNTILVYLNALEFFFEEILGLDVTENISKYHRTFKVKVLPSTDEIEILINSLESRERLMVLLIKETGIKIEDLALLKVEDIRKKDDKYMIKDFQITKDTARELLNFVERNELEEYIFVNSKNKEKLHPSSLRYQLRVLSKEILGKVCTASDIKHAIALEYIRKGMFEEASYITKNKSKYSLKQFFSRIGYIIEY